MVPWSLCEYITLVRMGYTTVPYRGGKWDTTLFGTIFFNLMVASSPYYREATLRIWDVLLCEAQRSVLFQVALTVLDLNAKELMQCQDSGDIIQCIQAAPTKAIDSSRLVGQMPPTKLWIAI